MRHRLHPAWWLLLALPWLAGLTRIRLDTEILNLLPDEVPAVRGLKLQRRHFTNARELLVTLRAPTPEAAEAAARRVAETLRARPELVARADWQPSWLERPDDQAALLAYLWLNQPPSVFAELATRLDPAQLDAVALEARERLATSLSPFDLARLGHDPFGFSDLPRGAARGGLSENPLQGFASEDGTFRVVQVESARALPDYQACAAWLSEVKTTVNAAIGDATTPDAVTWRATGAPAFVAEIASGMARDMQLTVTVTLILIAALFRWAHRGWVPLGLLVAMLALVLLGTLAAGGWIFGTLNAVSLGFGAILLGLAVDCGLVVFQEASAARDRSAAELRRELASSVGWSAITTASAFFLLPFVGLPGLSQMGVLVGIGVLLAPLVMLYLFLPLALRWLRRQPGPASLAASPSVPGTPLGTRLRGRRAATLLLLASGVVALFLAPPGLDRGGNAIEPRDGPAQVALRELREQLDRDGEPWLVVVEGRSESEVGERLAALERRLADTAPADSSPRALLPTAIWPRREFRDANASAARTLGEALPRVVAAATRSGFGPEALRLATNILARFAAIAPGASAAWPDHPACTDPLRRASARDGDRWLAAGAIHPPSGNHGSEELDALIRRLGPGLDGVWVSAWPLLGGALVRHVEHRVRWLVPIILVVVTTCLVLAFRRWVEVALALGGLGFLLLLVNAVLGLVGLSWNLMSLAALPLLLGVGVDYLIHVQIALRRHHGDLDAMHRVTGRAVLLCAATNAEGFGSNLLSSNPGLASLGTVCALGILVAYVASVHLLPAWWLLAGPANPRVPNPTAPGSRPPRPAGPSAAYGPRLWRLGLAVAPRVPRPFLHALATCLADAYAGLRPRRLRVLEDNLLPVVGGDPDASRSTARRLLRRFAVKIVDLLRHEGSPRLAVPVVHWSGYEILREALERGQGVLLVTPHLGNWEFGGSLLASKGVRLLVLTQDEPGEGFTELRRRARERWGVETLVVGRDAFGFVEIIKRLQEGSTVALLIDRPPPHSGVEVEFMGRPFLASIAPAELARASGCAVLPVHVVAEGDGYAARVLGEVPYDRRALGSREARRRFAGEVLRAFEPVIRAHPDQWYHFVPVWPSPPSPPAAGREA